MYTETLRKQGGPPHSKTAQ